MKNGKVTLRWPLIGNEHITEFLSRSLSSGAVGGAYIFTGPDSLGKTTAALYFARSLLCQGKGNKLPCLTCPACNQFKNQTDIDAESVHGDFSFVKRAEDKKNISIEQIRDLIRILNMSSFLDSYKIGIIKGADSLSLEAANALLKTLEEPKKKVIIILIAANPENLPATIASRSRILNFKLVETDMIYDYLIKKYKVGRSQAKHLSRLSAGRPALAVKFWEDKEFYEEYLNRAKVFLNFFSQDLNQRLSSLDNLFGKRISAQEARQETGLILEIWQSLTRDFLLLEWEQNFLTRHEVLLDELEKIKPKIRKDIALNLVDKLEQARAYLGANVTPKLVLEDLACAL